MAVAEALACAHRPPLRVIHRAIKPSNVLIRTSDAVVYYVLQAVSNQPPRDRQASLDGYVRDAGSSAECVNDSDPLRV